MKKIISFLFSLFCFTAIYAQDYQLKIDTKESSIKYEGDHLLHSWEGINNNIFGLAIFDANQTDLKKLAILCYVRDFDSNNSSRDAHSLEVLNELKYPEIKFYSDSLQKKDTIININGTFDFHGIKVKKSLSANFENLKKKYLIFGEFEIIPSDFNIDLPSFLSVKMDDLLKIEYRIVLKK